MSGILTTLSLYNTDRLCLRYPSIFHTVGFEDKQEGQDLDLDTTVFWHVVSHPLQTIALVPLFSLREKRLILKY